MTKYTVMAKSSIMYQRYMIFWCAIWFPRIVIDFNTMETFRLLCLMLLILFELHPLRCKHIIRVSDDYRIIVWFTIVIIFGQEFVYSLEIERLTWALKYMERADVEGGVANKPFIPFWTVLFYFTLSESLIQCKISLFCN